MVRHAASGIVLVTAFGVLLVLFGLGTALVLFLTMHLGHLENRKGATRAQYIALAGANQALAYLRNDPDWNKTLFDGGGSWEGTYDGGRFAVRVVNAPPGSFPPMTGGGGRYRVLSATGSHGAANRAVQVMLKQFSPYVEYLIFSPGPGPQPDPPLDTRISIFGSYPVGIAGGAGYSNTRNGPIFSNSKFGITIPDGGGSPTIIQNGDVTTVRGQFFAVRDASGTYTLSPQDRTYLFTGQEPWIGTLKPDGTPNVPGKYFREDLFQSGSPNYLSDSPPGIQYNGRVTVSAWPITTSQDLMSLTQAKLDPARDVTIPTSANIRVTLTDFTVSVYAADANGNPGSKIQDIDLASKPGQKMILFIQDNRTITEAQYQAPGPTPDDKMGVYVSGRLKGNLTLVSTTNILVDLNGVGGIGGVGYAAGELDTSASRIPSPTTPGGTIQNPLGTPIGTATLFTAAANGAVNLVGTTGSNNDVPVYGVILSKYGQRLYTDIPTFDWGPTPYFRVRFGAWTFLKGRSNYGGGVSPSHGNCYDWRLRPTSPDGTANPNFIAPPGMPQTVTPLAWKF